MKDKSMEKDKLFSKTIRIHLMIHKNRTSPSKYCFGDNFTISKYIVKARVLEKELTYQSELKEVKIMNVRV